MSYPITPKQQSYDVVIVGGAMLGSSVAWFLSDNADFNGSVLVVEMEPSYERSSTFCTNSCMRQQFSSELNVRISQFAADFVKNLRTYMGDDQRVPELSIQNFGYMYLADNEAFADVLRESHKVQVAAGAGTKLMSAEEIKRDYPFYQLDDIVLGSHNRVDEGYWDGMAVFEWWRRSSLQRGIEYISNRVVDINLTANGTQVESVTLATGEVISCGKMVNCSGPRAADTAKMAGIELPVEPRKRYTYIFEAEQPLDRWLPLTIDPSGVHVRQEGQSYYQAGGHAEIDPGVAAEDFEYDHALWEDKIWPAVATRIPQFEAIKVTHEWVGHYAYNFFDHNAILGTDTVIDNFYFVNGFSGHGLQQSPAMGRGTAELITYGEYRSLDLSPFNFERIANNQPFIEKAII